MGGLHYTENRIPNYDIDFRKEGQDHFFIHVQEPGRLEPSMTDPHSHNYYCLGFLYQGEMAHFADLRKSNVKSPAVLFLNIDQVHIHAQPEINCRAITMAFSAEFVYNHNKNLADHIDTVFSHASLQLSENQLEELDKYIRLICSEYAKGKDKNIEIIQCLLNIILIQCARFVEVGDKAAGAKKDLYTSFRNALKKNYMHNHQVRFYAEKLNTTTAVLNHVVKTASSKTPKQLIDERLFMEAKRLLYWSDATAREVAWELGFETDAYFSRFFKKYSGTTPKDFQKQIHAVV